MTDKRAPLDAAAIAEAEKKTRQKRSGDPLTPEQEAEVDAGLTKRAADIQAQAHADVSAKKHAQDEKDKSRFIWSLGDFDVE